MFHANGSLLTRGLLIALTCLAGLPVAAESLIYSVHRDGVLKGFVGGTVHMLAASDFPMPAAFDRAFEQAERVVFETDMAAMESPQFAMEMAQAMMLPAGQSLEQLLRPATLARLKRFMDSRQMPWALVATMSPGAIAMTLPVLELQRLGAAGLGVDAHYTIEAVRAGKALGQFETPREQIGFIRALGRDRPDDVINYTLDDMDDFMATFEAIKRAWRSGDLEYIERETLGDMAVRFPGIYALLVRDRNDRWMPQIERMFADPQHELVLVGAMHLAGSDGLIAQLERRGYTVAKLRM